MPDSALMLKKKVLSGESVSENEALVLLRESELVQRLLDEPKQKPDLFVGIRAREWRLLELSEIPFIHLLPEAQVKLRFFTDRIRIDEGVSLIGQRDGVLACHTSMILTIFLRLQFPEQEVIDKALGWILRFQHFRRGIASDWTGKDLHQRFGGCMNRTPCFYGVVKAVRALTEYDARFPGNGSVRNKLEEGLEYLLEHGGFKRLSDGSPIEPSMTELFYPWPYKSNILEVLLIMKDNNRMDDPRLEDARNILSGCRREDGTYHAEKVFMKSAWIPFDLLNKPGEWITLMVDSLLIQK